MARGQAQNHQFRTDYDVALLVEVIPIIARYADSEHPEAVAPAAYEAARAQAGFPDAPGARATRRALGNLPWYRLLELALAGKRRLLHNIGLAARDSGRAMSGQEAVVALRVMAARLGAVTLRPDQYDTALAALEREVGPSELPNAARIEAVLKTETETGWDRGLRLAGLQPRGRATSRRGICRRDAIVMFVQELGYVPNATEIQRYARLKQFSLAARSEHHRESVEHARQSHTEKGLPWPTGELPHHKRPPLNLQALDNPAARRGTSPDFWSDPERCITGLVRAYDIAAERRLRLTQKVQRRLASEFPGEVPGPSTIDRQARANGTTAARWREEAMQRRRRRRRRG